MTSPLLPRLRGRGVTVLVVSEPRFRCFWKTIRLKMYLHSIVLNYCGCPCFVYCLEWTNPRNLWRRQLKASILWTLIHLSMDLVKISKDMERVLNRLTAPRAPIDSVRKHGVEEFHGTSLEESDKAEFWLEKLQRALDKVNYLLDQMAKCVVSLLQGATYDWWKLVL